MLAFIDHLSILRDLNKINKNWEISKLELNFMRRIILKKSMNHSEW